MTKKELPRKRVYSEICQELLDYWRSGTAERSPKPSKRLLALVNRLNGSGIISVEIDYPESHSPSRKIVLTCSYDAMDNAGTYIGEIPHKVAITPSLLNGIDISVKGRDSTICAYIKDTFWHTLMRPL